MRIEISDNAIVQWHVSPNVTDGDRREVISPNELPLVFERYKDIWNPASILRAKNIAPTGQIQLDFIDAGLIPALEENIREKLDPLLAEF